MSQDKDTLERTVRPSDPTQTSERRRFMLGTLAVLPATSLLAACADRAASTPTSPEALGSTSAALRKDAGAHAAHAGHPGASCHDEARQAHQRARWRELLETHVGGENLHDLDVILESFADEGEMVFNGNATRGSDQLSTAHIMFGFSAGAPGGFCGTQVIAEREHYTDDSILIEGRVVADHVGVVGVFPATFRHVSLPYSAFYRFDDAGKLVSERIVMDFTPLALPPP